MLHTCFLENHLYEIDSIKCKMSKTQGMVIPFNIITYTWLISPFEEMQHSLHVLALHSLTTSSVIIIRIVWIGTGSTIWTSAKLGQINFISLTFLFLTSELIGWSAR
mmetsp:Transcript_5840/g.8019  ORF Transcript_5840/g.8019 Transcript_5840/m.8019 type:complete len:107 (+) Transcript_5840:42-362(+)